MRDNDYGAPSMDDMMSDNDYDAPSMDDLVDHDIDDTSTSMDYMAEHHHYYDYDAATVHDMESYTDFDPSSINTMADHYYDYNSNDLVEPHINYYAQMQSARAHNPPPSNVKDLQRGAIHHEDDDSDDEYPPRRSSRPRTQERHRHQAPTSSSRRRSSRHLRLEDKETSPPRRCQATPPSRWRPLQSSYAHESSSRNTKDLHRRTSTHDHHRRHYEDSSQIGRAHV